MAKRLPAVPGKTPDEAERGEIQNIFLKTVSPNLRSEVGFRRSEIRKYGLSFTQRSGKGIQEETIESENEPEGNNNLRVPRSSVRYKTPKTSTGRESLKIGIPKSLSSNNEPEVIQKMNSSTQDTYEKIEKFDNLNVQNTQSDALPSTPQRMTTTQSEPLARFPTLQLSKLFFNLKQSINKFI